MSSFSSVVPQSRAHVSVLSKLISADGMDTRLWLRGEIVRLVDPMLDALFLRLIMTPSFAEHQHSLTVSELCQLIEGEKEETNRLVRGKMDRLVNLLFLRVTNKLLVNMDWARSRIVGDRSQVVNPCDHVESSNTEPHQPVLIPQTSSIDPHFQQPNTIGVEEECNQQILTGVKRELEYGENEMRLEKIQDNTTLANQFGTGPSSTSDDHQLFHQIDSTLEDRHLSNQTISADHQQNGQVNNATDTRQDWDEHEFEEGDDEQMLEEEEEEIVDGSDHEEEVGDDETEIDSDNGEGDEVNQNEESFRLFTSPPLDTTSPASQSPIRRQSARIVKRTITEEEQLNEMANRDNKEDEEEDGEVAEEVTSRSVKRHRSSRHTTSIITKQKQIITQSSEKIATECTTNPTQPNLAQPNRHLQCSHCLKSFVNKTDLQRHLRVHTGERPFQCDECDKRFSMKCNLSQHQLIHQNIKRFRCHECDKQFTLKRQLDSHLRIHSGERPFECRYCEKSFAELNTRNNHERSIHLHVKPYRCKQCGHTATQRAHIIKHIRMVHFGLPKSIKQQQTLNIIDDRDPRELVEKV